MPIYEYHCEDCNQDFECLVFGGEEPDCPSCNSKNICRLMSACGFISKGSSGENTTPQEGLRRKIRVKDERLLRTTGRHARGTAKQAVIAIRKQARKDSLAKKCEVFLVFRPGPRPPARTEDEGEDEDDDDERPIFGWRFTSLGRLCELGRLSC